MIRRRRSLGFLFASVVVLGACAAGLAVVSGGRAGSGPSSSTDAFFVSPRYLNVGSSGRLKDVFTAAIDSGAVTHLRMIFDVPPELTVSPVPANCTGPFPSPDHPGWNRYICDEPNVAAGESVTQLVTVTAQNAPGDYTVYKYVTFDKGAGGGAGGRNRVPETGFLSGEVTIVPEGDRRRAGNCAGSASTGGVDAVDTQATAASLDRTGCVWVGEFPQSGNSLTPLSCEAGDPGTVGTVVITFYEQWTAPSKAVVLVDLQGDCSVEGAEFNGVPVPSCAVAQVPPEPVCGDLEKKGKGAVWTGKVINTGVDPPFGGG